MTRSWAPLPDPLQPLVTGPYRVGFGRGQLHMIAGPPGAGKTTLALLMALRMNVPSLYFSADSDDTTMAARAASALTQHDYSDVRRTQAYGLFSQEYGAVLKGLPLRFVFDPSEPSCDDIWNGIAAYIDVHGEAPHLVVVDNLLNMKHEGGDGNEWMGMRSTMKTLHFLARKSRACVWALHHTSEQSVDHITKAPPRSAIQGKLSQLPEGILTVANDQGVMWLAVVKNRHGASDPLAKEPIRMTVDFSRNRLWDTPMMQGVTFGSNAR